ncbi:MAG: DUF4350 domain-containing protein [Desulfuromonadales bacterium]|nr:DUF4350 domain-containing protein [Desulfuromonadales bacterium]
MPHFIVKHIILLGALLLLPLSSRGADANPRILFDQGHNERFLIEENGDLQLSRLAETFRAQLSHVSSTKASLNDETLKDVAALVISGPFQELKSDEIEAVARFVEKGGHLAVMLHIGPPLGPLLNRLDVDFSNSVLHERHNIIEKDLNFNVKDLSPGPLFTGITQFSAYGVWALKAGAGSAVIARTSPDAWVDLNGDRILSKGDAVGAFGVAVSGALGKGGFVVFGDDAIFQNRYHAGENATLATNLGAWLIGR